MESSLPIALVDDQEAFEAALCFVEEYAEVTSAVEAAGESRGQRGHSEEEALALSLDGLQSTSVLALESLESSERSSAALPVVGASSVERQSPGQVQVTRKKKAKKSGKKGGAVVASAKPKKPLGYNPNRAREQQHQELLYLREKVVDMQQKLGALQKAGRGPAAVTSSSVNTQEDPDASPDASSNALSTPAALLWKEMAGHQLEQRLRAERENRRLKAVLEGQIKIAKSLEKLLEARSTTQPMESCLHNSQRTRRMHNSAADRTGPSIFEELLAGVEESYREVDDIFRNNGLSEMEGSFTDAQMRQGPEGIFMEIVANKVLPFSVASTGTAAWEYFAKSMEHMPYRFLYQKDPQNLETTDDTIVESFAMELHANGTQADFRVKQILRRYVEEDRVVIVWRSFTDPVEFSGAPLRGAEFREKGYIVVRRPRDMSESFSLMQTCYLISPAEPVYTLTDEGAITGALTDFVLSGTAANIATGHQMIENVLFNEAMKTRSRV